MKAKQKERNEGREKERGREGGRERKKTLFIRRSGINSPKRIIYSFRNRHA